jgi:hypothetical protein
MTRGAGAGVGRGEGWLAAPAEGMEFGAVSRARGVARATIAANKSLRTAFLLLVLHHGGSQRQLFAGKRPGLVGSM